MIKIIVSVSFCLLSSGLLGNLWANEDEIDTEAAAKAAGKVTQISPTQASLNNRTQFTISGSLLPSSLAFAIADAECSKLSGSSSQASFACIPRVAGNKAFVVKDAPGGTALASGLVSIGSSVAAPAPSAPPQSAMNISSASAATALILNQAVTFNLSGSGLQSGQIRISLTNCENSSVQALSASQARFTCTPRAAGAQRLFWKKPGSEDSITLGEHLIATPVAKPPVSEPAPPTPALLNISSASPTGPLQMNQPVSFNLSGTNLQSSPIRISLTNCDNSSVQVLSPTQARFTCTPRASGMQRLFWKKPDSEVGFMLSEYQITAATPSPAGNGNYASTNSLLIRHARQAGIPPIIPKAMAYLESQWDHLLNGRPKASSTNCCFGIMQVKGAASESEEQNIQLGMGILNQKWQLNVSSGAVAALSKIDGIEEDFDKRILENWFFPIAAYNGSQKLANGQSGYKLADQYTRSVYSIIANPADALNYAATTPAARNVKAEVAGFIFPRVQITSPSIIPGFNGGTTDQIQPYSLCQMVRAGGMIHRYNFDNDSVEDYTAPIRSKCAQKQGTAPIQTSAIQITQVAPLSGPVGQPLTFTVSGVNLPPTLAINLDGERCYNDTKPAANQVKCDVTRLGINPRLTVKDKPGGQELRTFQFEGKAPPQVPMSGKIAAPLSKLTITQDFGNYLGVYGGIAYKGYHTGTDFRGGRGTPVFSIADGTVSRVAPASSANPASLGWYVVIDHPALNIRSVYVHTEKPGVSKGQNVRAGEQIAELGKPTQVPSHLHLEVQRFDRKVVDSRGNFAPFVNKSTSPVGNRGYASRAGDLASVWLDPVKLLNSGGTAKAVEALIEQGANDFSAHAYNHDVQEDDPMLQDQVSRQKALDQLARLAVQKGLAQSATSSEMQRLGLFQGSTLSRPADMASRMEVALMVNRLIAPLKLATVNAEKRFALEEFGSTPEATEQDYQNVVNYLYQTGIINGQQDHLGEWRYYPTRKISLDELGKVTSRLETAIPVRTSAPAPLPVTPIPMPFPATPPAPVQLPVTPPGSNPVGLYLSSTSPAVGETVMVNLTGNLPVQQASDIYLYLKVAQLGGQVTWYYNRQLNDDGAKPWRASVQGPNLPETNPVLQYAPRLPGAYAVGILVVPAGTPINMGLATETSFTVQ